MPNSMHDLTSPPGMQPGPLQWKHSLNHSIARKVPQTALNLKDL